jgi:hypothetical protein
MAPDTDPHDPDRARPTEWPPAPTWARGVWPPVRTESRGVWPPVPHVRPAGPPVSGPEPRPQHRRRARVTVATVVGAAVWAASIGLWLDEDTPDHVARDNTVPADTALADTSRGTRTGPAPFRPPRR